MTHITLALPYALPPPEMAADLLRALKAPALATLVSRHSTLNNQVFDDSGHWLAHEAWLAQRLGLGLGSGLGSATAGAPMAAAVMRSLGLAGEGHWFILEPAHVQISRTHMLLSDPRQLRLEAAESRALFELLQPYVADLGHTLVYGDAGLWFLRADDWSGLRTTTSDAVLGQSMSDWLPQGEHARAFRKLQNEAQMLWHEHPVNEARLARGLQPVNFFWLWGGADAGSQASAPAPASATIAIAGGPAWMQALSQPPGQPDAAQLIEQARSHQANQAIIGGRATAMLADLIPEAIAGDWAAWIAQVQRMEQEWFAPLLAALRDGSLGSLTLIPTHRQAGLEVTTTGLSLRKFWRRPTLNLLNT